MPPLVDSYYLLFVLSAILIWLVMVGWCWNSRWKCTTQDHHRRRECTSIFSARCVSAGGSIFHRCQGLCLWFNFQIPIAQQDVFLPVDNFASFVEVGRFTILLTRSERAQQIIYPGPETSQPRAESLLNSHKKNLSRNTKTPLEVLHQVDWALGRYRHYRDWRRISVYL